jgi:small GTP-binding protein
MQKPIILKICVFGNRGVGKSTIISQCFKEYNPENLGASPKKTIGVEFFQDDLEVDGLVVKLQIWELMGDKRFWSIYKNYVIGSAAGIFIYDMTDNSSLKNLDKLLKIIKKGKKNANLPILMVGNKADLQDKKKISIEHASKLAASKSMIGAIEISAMNTADVKELFINLTRIILRIDPKRHIIDVFKNKLNMRILILLKIFDELSMTNLAYHTGKSKATISRRTRELIRLGLIDSFSKDDEPQAGNIKRNYYKLSKNFDALLEKKDYDLKDIISNDKWEDLLEILTMYSYYYKKIKFISDHMNDHIGAIENLLLTSVAMERLPMIEVITLLMESLENNTMNFRFLTEEQYKEVKNLNKEYIAKIDKILEKDEKAERPFLYINLLLPILSITKKAVKHSSYLLRLRPS